MDGRLLRRNEAGSGPKTAINPYPSPPFSAERSRHVQGRLFAQGASLREYMNAIAVALVAALVLKFAVETVAELLNVRASKATAPPSLADIYKPTDYARSQAYLRPPHDSVSSSRHLTWR